MKKIIVLLLAVTTLVSWDVVNTPKELISQFENVLLSPSEISIYEFSENNEFKYVLLPFDFASNQMKDSSVMNQLKDAHIKYIRYVYSDFKIMNSFEQDKLNKERLFSLYHFLPSLFNSNDVEWEAMVQTKAKSVEEASKLFHGFIVYYRQKPTAESMRKELAIMNETIDKAINSGRSTAKNMMIIETEDVAFISKDVMDVDVVSTPDLYSSSNSDYLSNLVISSVFQRNKNWSNMLVNCDLTGSMGIYSSQLFIWYKLNMTKNKVQHFVFFNDGDGQRSSDKVAGSTGGIYHSKAKDFEALRKVATKCMTNGGGGDVQENDVEALLEGFDKCKDCGDVILIADNWANMRDFEMIKKINRPVHVILCGAQFGINVQYLDLARATGGSVHTIEKDISNLMDLKEGEKIRIGGKFYKIDNGGFIKFKK